VSINSVCSQTTMKHLRQDTSQQITVHFATSTLRPVQTLKCTVLVRNIRSTYPRTRSGHGRIDHRRGVLSMDSISCVQTKGRLLCYLLFVGFCAVNDSSGEGLSETLETLLHKKTWTVHIVAPVVMPHLASGCLICEVNPHKWYCVG
jgi:hypothetical protein